MFFSIISITGFDISVELNSLHLCVVLFLEVCRVPLHGLSRYYRVANMISLQPH